MHPAEANLNLPLGENGPPLGRIHATQVGRIEWHLREEAFKSDELTH